MVKLASWIIEKCYADIQIFQQISVQEKAVLEAYLKRFSSVQDFLGAKVFPQLLEISGIGSIKMSEVLYAVEKEEIITSLDEWIELREVRNALEHDYPDELEQALKDLEFCINSFDKLSSYYLKTLEFSRKYIHETIWEITTIN